MTAKKRNKRQQLAGATGISRVDSGLSMRSPSQSEHRASGKIRPTKSSKPNPSTTQDAYLRTSPVPVTQAATPGSISTAPLNSSTSLPSPFSASATSVPADPSPSKDGGARTGNTSPVAKQSDLRRRKRAAALRATSLALQKSGMIGSHQPVPFQWNAQPMRNLNHAASTPSNATLGFGYHPGSTHPLSVDPKPPYPWPGSAEDVRPPATPPVGTANAFSAVQNHDTPDQLSQLDPRLLDRSVHHPHVRDGTASRGQPLPTTVDKSEFAFTDFDHCSFVDDGSPQQNAEPSRSSSSVARLPRHIEDALRRSLAESHSSSTKSSPLFSINPLQIGSKDEVQLDPRITNAQNNQIAHLSNHSNGSSPPVDLGDPTRPFACVNMWLRVPFSFQCQFCGECGAYGDQHRARRHVILQPPAYHPVPFSLAGRYPRTVVDRATGEAFVQVPELGSQPVYPQLYLLPCKKCSKTMYFRTNAATLEYVTVYGMTDITTPQERESEGLYTKQPDVQNRTAIKYLDLNPVLQKADADSVHMLESLRFGKALDQVLISKAAEPFYMQAAAAISSYFPALSSLPTPSPFPLQSSLPALSSTLESTSSPDNHEQDDQSELPFDLRTFPGSEHDDWLALFDRNNCPEELEGWDVSKLTYESWEQNGLEQTCPEDVES